MLQTTTSTRSKVRIPLGYRRPYGGWRRLTRLLRIGGSGTTVGATPTPYGGRGTYDTPLRTPYSSDKYGVDDVEGGEPLSKRIKFDTDMSLDNFQAKYTSEDNASFLEILVDENKKRKETYGWAYHAQKRVEEQRERMLEGRERLLIEPPQMTVTGVREKFRIEAPNPVGLITQGEIEEAEGERGEGRELVVISGTKDEEVVDVMAPKKDTRAAGVDGWEFKVSSSVRIPDSHVLKESLGEKCSHVRSGRRHITTYGKECFRSTPRSQEH
jgi:protein DGCR14